VPQPKDSSWFPLVGRTVPYSRSMVLGSLSMTRSPSLPLTPCFVLSGKVCRFSPPIACCHWNPPSFSTCWCDPIPDDEANSVCAPLFATISVFFRDLRLLLLRRNRLLPPEPRSEAYRLKLLFLQNPPFLRPSRQRILSSKFHAFIALMATFECDADGKAFGGSCKNG